MAQIHAQCQRQTSASWISQELSQMVPQVSLYQISTLPSVMFGPFTNLRLTSGAGVTASKVKSFILQYSGTSDTGHSE